MKPQARIQALIDIYDQIQSNDRVPMDTVVGDYMRHRRYIGSKDRANIAERAYNVMRHYARLGWWICNHGTDDNGRTRALGWLALGEQSDQKYIEGLFDGSQYAPEALSDDELSFLSALVGKDMHAKDMSVDVRAECPPLYKDRLMAYFGDDFEEEMAAMLQTATLDLRVNTFLATQEKAQNFLEADGVKTEPTPYSKVGLRCANKAYLSRTKAFNKGWIEIQDEGSQLIAQMSGAQPGMQVLDYCAGAGGKTLAMAAMMERKGRIVAMDNDERRLMKGRERYKKAKVADIIEVRPLSEARHVKWLKRQTDKFDIVLLDVPCTGTGTWRRNPDMRWTVYGPSLDELTAIQAEIMDKTSHAVKPGGVMVYATCSLLPDENEQQIEAFLKRHDDFEVRAIDPALGLGSPYMRLTPKRHQTDGFFTALLHKK